MTGHICLVLALGAILTVPGHTYTHSNGCKVTAKIKSGTVCGIEKVADDGSTYASFRGVPYAKPPINERRFKELEELPDGEETFHATEEGPICLQTDVLYGRFMQPRNKSEDCIYANVHVPIDALPGTRMSVSNSLPILVYIHGGGFAFGSGDSDMYGPEYLVSKNIIVITFNYRLNVFGFLSLNSHQVPGNLGLRDMIVLLRWVKNNARAFGGDPDNVTLGGQSAGAIAAHLLTLSRPAKGLFKRTIMMSGTAISSFYSISPHFSKFITKMLLEYLHINTTATDVYQQLMDLPAAKLSDANEYIIEQFGFTTFVPTVEASFPGVTPVVDDEPELLLAQGRGKAIPLLVGHTSSECETFRSRLVKFDLVQKSKENPYIIIPPKILFSTPPHLLPEVYKKFERRYYHGSITVDGFIHSCTEGFFEYPIFKLVEARGAIDAASMYVYNFSYENDKNIVREIAGSPYSGAAHIEDMTYVFKTNSEAKLHNSGNMKNFMTKFIVNFMTCSKPICDQSESIWPAATSDGFLHEDIHMPYAYDVKGISPEQQEIIEFFDTLTE